MKLTENQKQFLIERFFKHNVTTKDYRISFLEDVTKSLLEQGVCIVSGSTYEPIWRGGIGNFIKVRNAENAIGCVQYTFNLEEFISSPYYVETKEAYLNPLKQKLNEIEAL